jgi:hypothetical protein
LLLPVLHLAGMHSVMGSDFLNDFLSPDRLQRDSCFHFRAELRRRLDFIPAPFPSPRFYTLLTGPNFGEHFIEATP